MKDTNPFSELIEESEMLYEQAFTAGNRAGIKEVIEWVKKHELTSPRENSITRFYPFYQIEERELKEWVLNESNSKYKKLEAMEHSDNPYEGCIRDD